MYLMYYLDDSGKKVYTLEVNHLVLSFNTPVETVISGLA